MGVTSINQRQVLVLAVCGTISEALRTVPFKHDRRPVRILPGMPDYRCQAAGREVDTCTSMHAGSSRKTVHCMHAA